MGIYLGTPYWVPKIGLQGAGLCTVPQVGLSQHPGASFPDEVVRLIRCACLA